MGEMVEAQGFAPAMKYAAPLQYITRTYYIVGLHT